MITLKWPTYFDKHFERKDYGENVIGRAQKHSLVAIRWYVRPLHSQRDAVERYEREHRVVEPFLFDKLPTQYPKTLLHTMVSVLVIVSTNDKRAYKKIYYVHYYVYKI